VPIGVVTPLYGRKETRWSQDVPAFTSVGLTVLNHPLASVIQQGTEPFRNRLGRRIMVRRIFWHGQLLGAQTNSVADDPYNTVRLMLVRVAPGTTAPAMTVNNSLDPRVTASGLLEVLYDHTRVISVNAKDSTGYIANAQEWEFEVSCNILLEYSAAGAVAPFNQDLRLWAVSDSSAVVNPGFSSTSQFTIEYLDAV